MEKRLLALVGLVIAFVCHGQLPVVPVALTTSSGTWYPTNAANQLFYQLELYPTNSARTNTTFTLNPPIDGQSVGNWGNIPNGGSGTATATIPVYRSSGGGYTGTDPRLQFTKRINEDNHGGTETLTNFTVMMVITSSNIATANCRILSAGGGFDPYIQFNAGKLEINAGTLVSGAATILGVPYIITWIQAGASSKIQTNGVDYVSGNSGTHGMSATLGFFYFANPTVNQLVGDVSRIWCWTNTLSAGDMASALAQCKTDFHFP